MAFSREPVPWPGFTDMGACLKQWDFRHCRVIGSLETAVNAAFFIPIIF
jgi:hypothetical protein